VWATGCATGEEAYFIGMCLLERVASRERNGKLQIFATDIDSHALEIARVGTYPDGMASSLAPECITRFFTKSDYSYRVKKELHEAMVSAAICLEPIPLGHRQPVTEPPREPIGIGSYLPRARVAAEGHRAVSFRPQPERLSIPGQVRDRRPSTEPVRAPLEEVADLPAQRAGPAGAGGLSAHPGGPTRRAPGRAAATPAQARRPWGGDPSLVAGALCPGRRLVSRDCQALYFRGQTDDYLVHPAGEPTDDLLAMAREGPRLKLRAALHRKP
jgi:two-component system, chemotaxis family, CheB/CheR fusion protein